MPYVKLSQPVIDHLNRNGLNPPTIAAIDRLTKINILNTLGHLSLFALALTPSFGELALLALYTITAVRLISTLISLFLSLCGINPFCTTDIARVRYSLTLRESQERFKNITYLNECYILAAYTIFSLILGHWQLAALFITTESVLYLARRKTNKMTDNFVYQAEEWAQAQKDKADKADKNLSEIGQVERI